MLTPSQFNKWITALRSGKFKQGTRRLYTKETNSFCCLGVLRRVCKIDSHPQLNIVYLDPKIVHQAEQYRLSEMNDRQNCNFSSIADYLEANKSAFVRSKVKPLR